MRHFTFLTFECPLTMLSHVSDSSVVGVARSIVSTVKVSNKNEKPECCRGLFSDCFNYWLPFLKFKICLLLRSYDF